MDILYSFIAVYVMGVKTKPTITAAQPLKSELIISTYSIIFNGQSKTKLSLLNCCTIVIIEAPVGLQALTVAENTPSQRTEWQDRSY